MPPRPSSPAATAPRETTALARPAPAAGRLETLLGSPYWPLGSSFLKLLSFPPAFRNTFCLGASAAAPLPKPKDDCPKLPPADQSAPRARDSMDLDLDGSPIGSDGDHADRAEAGHQDEEEEEDDRALEELLVQPHPRANRHTDSARKPSLSDRLTEPNTWTQRSYIAHRSYRDYERREPSRLPFSSIPRNTNLLIKGLADLKRSSGHPSETIRTSSNLIDCDAELHPWGNKRPNPTSAGHHSSTAHSKRARLSESSPKPSESKRWVRDRYQECDEGHEDRSGSEKTHSHRHRWPNSYQKSEQHKQQSFDAHTSHTSEAHGRASSVTVWKKPGAHPGSKHHSTRQDFREEVADRERRWTQEFKQYDVARTARTRSISPPPSSHRRSPSRHSPESAERGYYKLSKIPSDVEEALHRAVFSWINRSLAEALFRLGMWLQEKKVWAPNEWGSIRVDQLEKVVDLTYARGVDYLLWKCNTEQFKDLLQKPIQSGIFHTHKNPQNAAWYISFCKDYTPSGLLYRPLIKGCRKHLMDSKTQKPIQAGKFMRQYVMCDSDEDDLLYLFKDDQDPMGCLRRAETDGIIELTDEPFYQGPIGTGRGNEMSHKETSIENQYLKLKPYWMSNKEPAEHRHLSAPIAPAQACTSAQEAADEGPSALAPKTATHEDDSEQAEPVDGGEESSAPAIDRRNSDNTAVSVNTTSTSTDTSGAEQPERAVPADDVRGAACAPPMPAGALRAPAATVDELVQTVIGQLGRDAARRRRY